MERRFPAVILAVCCFGAVAPQVVYSQGERGREFPSTLLIDEPGVSDELTLPSFSVQRQGATGDLGPGWRYNLGLQFEKRITDDFSISVGDAFTIQSTHGDKTRTGFLNLTAAAKYQVWADGPHEVLVSLGLIREFGRTGTAHVGADQYGSTTPTLFFGKGMGDLPSPLLRPFALTGTFGYTIADKQLKAIAAPETDTGITGLETRRFNNGSSNRWIGGLSLQYSLPYLRSRVGDYGFPDFVNRLTPVVEVAWSSPASKPTDLGTQLVFAPGVIYSGEDYQVGVAALIPGNRASGRNVGAIAQLRLSLDDLVPNSLGKPLFTER